MRWNCGQGSSQPPNSGLPCRCECLDPAQVDTVAAEVGESPQVFATPMGDVTFDAGDTWRADVQCGGKFFALALTLAPTVVLIATEFDDAGKTQATGNTITYRIADEPPWTPFAPLCTALMERVPGINRFPAACEVPCYFCLRGKTE